jgi:acid stress-induced BolA-like protein IbaG/YrbA
MQAKDIKNLIETGIPGCSANVKGDGTHWEAIVISSAFAGKSRIQKQQLVYATLGNHIHDGTIHALSIKTFTPDEWHQQNNNES